MKMITFINHEEISRLVDELPEEKKEKLLTQKIQELSPESRARILRNIIPSVQPETIFNQLTKLYKVGNRKK